MTKNKKITAAAILMVLTLVILVITDALVRDTPSYPVAESLAAAFIEENAQQSDKSVINIKDYPEELLALLEKNPEAKDFVLNYPLMKDKHQSFSMEEYKDCTAVPLLMQWDMRWGYEEYAGSIIGLSGCGPVCLSMIAIYLTGDILYDPLYVARFAEENGYAAKNNGTKWTLMSEGAAELGLISEELPLHKESIINALDSGRPVILIMGEGDFTSSGHFIVLTAYDEEGFTVLDPNSGERSGKKWTYERIESQIRNIWCFSVQ